MEPVVDINELNRLPCSVSVVFRRSTGYVRPRQRTLTVMSAVHRGEHWGVHGNTFKNGLAAIGERVFLVKGANGLEAPPTPRSRRYLNRTLNEFKEKLLTHVGVIQPMSTEEFVDTYVGRKRRMYENVVRELELRPLVPADVNCQCFIKDEKVNRSAKERSVPRIIQPRSARFNVEIGVLLKPMEKPIFHGVSAIFGDTTVFKGLNADARGVVLWRKWKRFDNPWAIMLDASRFDQHVSREMLDWENHIEEAICGDRNRLKYLNHLRRSDKCYFLCQEGTICYRSRGCRKSGDMDTAMANCMTMCAMTWSFMKAIGVSKYEYANDGDDGVLIVEKADRKAVLDNYKEWFELLGFTMKLEGESGVFEKIEFCQAHPVLTNSGAYRMVRDPRVCLSKDSIALNGCNDYESLMQQRNSVGWCGLSLAGDMPIFNSFYRHLINGERVSRECRSGMDYLALGMDPKDAEPSDEVRESFFRAYDIAPDNQRDIELFIDNLPAPCCGAVPSDVCIGIELL